MALRRLLTGLLPAIGIAFAGVAGMAGGASAGEVSAFDLIGVRLGMTPDQVRQAVDGRCWPTARLGGTADGAEISIACLLDGRGRLSVTFTRPDQGHRAWQIDLDYRGKIGPKPAVIARVIQKFGPPDSEHRIAKELWWREGSSNLRVTVGARRLGFQLWDVSHSQRSPLVAAKPRPKIAAARRKPRGLPLAIQLSEMPSGFEQIRF
jgi:hypothetical protein